MLWFKKQADAGTGGGRESIRPGALGIELDAAIFSSKLDQMLTAMAEKGGVERFIESLTNKHRLFNELLAAENLDALDRDAFRSLLECVFTARRKLPEALAEVEHQTLVTAIKDLLYGGGALTERMNTFEAVVGADKKKARRAAWDFAAELLHFNAPDTYPLMSRWVWDRNTVSGAMREFIRANDGLADIPIPGDPEAFEAARIWFVQQFNDRGFYRDLHFLIDLVLAQAYADYLIAMSSGMGMLGSDFGPKNEPLDLVVKLLGIDPDRRGGKSKIKQPVLH